jgi:hypothetical protein
MTTLTGKRAIVVGANRGLGQVIVFTSGVALTRPAHRLRQRSPTPPLASRCSPIPLSSPRLICWRATGSRSCPEMALAFELAHFAVRDGHEERCSRGTSGNSEGAKACVPGRARSLADATG